MYLPNDIEEIIYKYVNQLKLININKEFKKNVDVKIFSEGFSEYKFYNKNPRIVNYYRKQDRILMMFRNAHPNSNKFNIDTKIIILQDL